MKNPKLIKLKRFHYAHSRFIFCELLKEADTWYSSLVMKVTFILMRIKIEVMKTAIIFLTGEIICIINKYKYLKITPGKD